MNAPPVKVLLIEDEPVSARLLREILPAMSQFELTRVGRLDEALQRLGAGPFDAVLLDLSLPDKKDLTAYHELHAAAPAMPIVVLTGPDEETLAFQAVREGAQDYLVKGEFDGKMFSRVIRYAMERKRADEELRQSAEFFKLISENVTDLIAVIDRDGKRLYNSPSYQRSLGDASDLQGTNSFQEIHPDDQERIKRIFQETIARGIGQRSEYRMLWSDGTVRHIESQGSVIKDANGSPSKVVVVSRDITERIQQMEALRKTLSELHQAHEDLKAAQMQLVQSEKLEAVSTFAGGIAHEVKNPLQTIILGVDFLKNTFGNAGADVQMVLNEMDNAARRADAVFLLQQTRRQRPRFKPDRRAVVAFRGERDQAAWHQVDQGPGSEPAADQTRFEDCQTRFHQPPAERHPGDVRGRHSHRPDLPQSVEPKPGMERTDARPVEGGR